MYKSLIYENVDFDVNGALKKEVSEKGYFDKKILKAIENEKFDDVEMYENLATFLHIDLAQSTKDKIMENNTFFTKSLRNTKEFSSGFWTGKGESAIGISGSILSDMTVVGDVRDLSTEGIKFANDKKYDKVVLSVAAVGVGLSVSQLLSTGASTPLKVGASVIKIAKKTGKLSKAFLGVISSKLAKAVDMKILKKIDFSSLNAIKKNKTLFLKSLKLKGISKLFGNINKIKKNTSVFDTVSILKYVDNEKELTKVVKLSSKYKKNTKGVLKVLGKTALRGSSKIIKYTTVFISQLILAIFSFIGFLIGVFINLKMLIFWIKKC